MYNGIILGINNIFNLFYFLIILRIFLTWIPSIRWDNNPFRTIRAVTDLYLNLFRKIIPSFQGLDFSPIIALIVLQLLQYGVNALIRAIFLAYN
ncbi:MAG: YggT family protein [Candidatus Gastranaerophilales bacterium]